MPLNSPVSYVPRADLEIEEVLLSWLVSGEIQTADEYLAKGKPQKSESIAEEIPKGQIAAMMRMAYFADGITAHANDFF